MRDKELKVEDVETSHTRWSGGRWYLRRGVEWFGSSRVECVCEEKSGESEI
jgi:hypothetical protein